MLGFSTLENYIGVGYLFYVLFPYNQLTSPHFQMSPWLPCLSNPIDRDMFTSNATCGKITITSAALFVF
jgi:hypothetical protein